jgi:hypothetical protein
VLHIWDQAGVAFILAKFQQINGNESKVIRVKNADKYGINEFYKEYGLFVAPGELVNRSIEEARRANVIHIHSLPEMVINIRNTYKESKVIILHYHGTDIRGSEDNSRIFNLRNILGPKYCVMENIINQRFLYGVICIVIGCHIQ